MGNKLIVQRLENASKTGTLTLCKLNLKELPSDIAKLTASNLRTLDLSDNKLKEFPTIILEFLTLKHLKLDHNRLDSLPENFGSVFSKLETFFISYNLLTVLPPSFSSLSNLKVLNLSKNQISTFPTPILDLKLLDNLDLSQNLLTVLPAEISRISAVEMNFNQNQLTNLTEKVAECPNLKILRLQENCLQLNAFTRKVFVESKLTVLAVEGNLFDMNDFRTLNGYDQIMERSTENRKKIF